MQVQPLALHMAAWLSAVRAQLHSHGHLFATSLPAGFIQVAPNNLTALKQVGPTATGSCSVPAHSAAHSSTEPPAACPDASLSPLTPPRLNLGRPDPPAGGDLHPHRLLLPSGEPLVLVSCGTACVATQ